MAAKNAVGEDRRFWAVLPVMHGAMLAAIAQQAEASGLEGLFSVQVYGPPFIPLAAAASATNRIKLATGIAIAPVRSPFETAMAALDLDRISDGRFILGLGASVTAWTKGVFGEPEVKPLTHLRETVEAVRYIVKNAHKGLKPYHSQYYNADFEALSLTAEPVRDEIPIWIAALREKATRLGAEIADGMIGHPMWSVEWTTREMAPAFLDAIAKSGRKRTDVEVSIWPWAAPNPDVKQGVNDARPSIAFYARIKQYESFFEAHGFGKEARKCQEEVGDYLKAAEHVPDEMVKAFVAVGDLDQVRERLEPIWTIADSMCIVPPAYNMTPDSQMYYLGEIGKLNAG